MAQTPQILEYVPGAAGAQLVRLYADDPCPALPARIAGLPLTALAPYCFAETQRESALPAPAARCWAVWPPDAAPAAPSGGAMPLPGRPETLPPAAAGRFLQGVCLPDSLRVLGDCAFYNCRALAWLEAGADITVIGSDVFLNTFALAELRLRAAPDAPSSLFRLAGNIQTELRALFCPPGAGGHAAAAARFPEYWEDIEETPAHILLHTYSGQGYHYRQCFQDGVLDWAEYDSVFPMARAEDPPACMTLLALDRLRWPHDLSADAAAAYRAFLAKQADAVLAALRKAQDVPALDALLALDVLDRPALTRGLQAAVDAQDTAFAARLTAALGQSAPAAPVKTGGTSRGRYDMDF